ncbi:very large A-kinase anchor protein [Anolis carolinensis]|uniref:very large A-kinase anchor protein n=1 Tax=Anolis carolinensis TaxID=28377 RepID=UPI002F2B61EA
MSGANSRRRTGSFWQNSFSRLFSRSASKEEGDKAAPPSAQGEGSFEAKANESTNVLNERKESDPLPELLKFAVCENKNLSTEDLSRSTTQEEIKKANSLPSLAHGSKTTHNERQVKEGFFQYLGSLFGISSKSSLKETEQLAAGNRHDNTEKDFESLSSHQESGHIEHLIEPEIFVISTSESKQAHSDKSEDINFVKRPNSGLQNLHKGKEKFPEAPEKTAHELGAAAITYATYRGSTRIKQLLKKQAELEQEKETTSNISTLENKDNQIVNIPDSDMTIRKTESVLKMNSKAGTEVGEKDSHSSTSKLGMDPQKNSQDVFESSKSRELKNSVLSTEIETINNCIEDSVSMKTVSFSNTSEVNGNLLLEPALLPKESSSSFQNTDPIRMGLKNNRLAEKGEEVLGEIQMQHPSNNATIVGFQKEMPFCNSSNTEAKEPTQLEFSSHPKVDSSNNEQQLVEDKYCCNNWTEDLFTLKSTNQELHLNSTIASGEAISQTVITNEDFYKNVVAEQNEQSLQIILPNNSDFATCKINSNKDNTVSIKADVSTLVQPSDTIQGMDVLRKSSENEEDSMSVIPRGIQNSPSLSVISEIGIDGFPTGNLCVPVVESEHVGVTTLLPSDTTIGNTNTSMLAIGYENVKSEVKATALEVKDTSTDKAELMANAYLQRPEDKKGSSHHLVKKDEDETLTNASINLDVSFPTLELDNTGPINNTESGVMVNHISSPLKNTEDIEIKSLVMATESNIPLVNEMGDQTDAKMNPTVLETKEIISISPSKEMCLSKDFSVVKPENNCSSSVFPSHSLPVLVNKSFIHEADNICFDTVSKSVSNFEDQCLLKTSYSLCHEKEGIGECMRAPAIIDFAETEYGNIDSDPTHENIHAISKQKTFESLSTLLATGVQPEDTDGVSDSFLETDSTLKTKIVSDSSEVDIKNKISSCLEERTAVTDTGSVDLILIKEDPFLITFENVCTSATSTTCPKVTPKLYSPTCATIDAISLEEIGSLPRNSEDALGKISPEHKSDSLTSESISKAACPPPLLEHIAYDMEAIEPVKMILGLSFAAQQSKQAEKTPSGQLNHHYLTDVSEHPTERDDQAITKSSRLDFEEPPKYVETGKQVQIKSHDLTVLLKKADEIVDAVLHLAIEEIRSKQTAGVCQTNDIKDNLLETSLQKDQNIIKKLSESKEIQSKNSSLKSFNESYINKLPGVKEEGTLSINIQDKIIALETTDNTDLHSSITLIAKEIIDDVINVAKQKLMYDLGEDHLRKAVSQNAKLKTEISERFSTDTEVTVKSPEIIEESFNLTPACSSEIHKIIIEAEEENSSAPLYVNMKKDNKEGIAVKIVTKNVPPCQKNGDELSDPAAAVEFSDAETGQSNDHKGASCTPQMINADDKTTNSTANSKSEKPSHVINVDTLITEKQMTLCPFVPVNVPPFNPNVDTYTCMFSKSKDECEPSLESNVKKELPQYICQDGSAMLVREPIQNYCEINNERDLGEINKSRAMLQDETIESSMTELSIINNSAEVDQNPDFLHKNGAIVGPDLSMSNVLKQYCVDVNDDRDGAISPKLFSFSAPKEWEGNSSFTILYEDALHTDGDESHPFPVEQPEKHFYVPNLTLDNSQHFVMCRAEKSILPFEGNDQSNKMLESTSSESFLTVEAKRFRVYPFSLSPIYEDDSSQEDLLSTDISPGDNLNEKSRNNQSLSVLSLLQSVSERLKSSDQCQEEEEEAYISSHWTGHSSSIVPKDIYEKGLFSKHSSFLSMEAFSTKEALSFSTSCSAQLLQDFDHGMKSSSKSIYYEALQSKSSYEGEKGTQLGSILLSRDPQPENCDLQRRAWFQACPVDRERLKCNPRPGKMIICDVHGKTNKYEIYHDVIDLTGWVFSKEVLIRVIRGCWVLYEKPGFQGQKYYLEEGEMMLNDILNQQTEKHKGSFTIGSIRQIMKNCSVPEIQLYPEGHSEYFPISIQSAIADVEELEIKNLTLSVKAGVWFAYSDVNYKGEVMVLEENCPCEISTADIKSLYPLKMGSLKVQMPLNVQIILYERPHFGGWCKELSENIDCIPILFENVGDFQGIGSIRVIGGIWVAYEKERYKGQQYLLEEGEYEDWTSWGGMNSTLLSFRFLQANFMESAITLFETDEEDGKLLDIVNEEIPDLEVAGYGLVTRSINVKSGVWVAYQQKYFCGEQYVLEKGKYKCFFDWGGSNETIMSIRPVNLEPLGSHEPKHRLKAFSNVHFQGTCMDITTEVAGFASFSPCSFKVLRGCWLLHYQGSSDNDQCVLEEDLYTDLASCGCPAAAVKSLKPIEYVFAESFISLFALENCEGREWHLQEAVGSVVNKDLHFLTQSVWVKSGLWIAYEGCNFVGKQFLLTAGKISNWTQFSGWKVIGSLRPVKQPAVYFRIKNKSQDRYLTVAGNLMDARASSVCLSPLNGKNTQIWCYSCGLIKSKVNDACLDVIGGRDTPGAKVALWAEHGKARQKWTYNKDGTISSYLNDQLVLDIKGGCYYDRNHIVVNQVNGGECTQKWDIEIL